MLGVLDRIAPCEDEALGMQALLDCHLLDMDWGTHYLQIRIVTTPIALGLESTPTLSTLSC